MGFYPRCRRLQSGAAAPADSGGLLMAATLRQSLCRPLAHRRNGYQATFANAAEFFNSLLEAISVIPFARTVAEIEVARTHLSIFCAAIWESGYACVQLLDYDFDKGEIRRDTFTMVTAIVWRSP